MKQQETQKELFTPGEWNYSPVMNFSDTIVSFINSSTGKPVAQLRGCGNGEEREAEANAALIAQAKNMYYALKMVQKYYDDTPTTQKLGEAVTDSIDIIHAVLQKANPQL